MLTGQYAAVDMKYDGHHAWYGRNLQEQVSQSLASPPACQKSPLDEALAVHKMLHLCTVNRSAFALTEMVNRSAFPLTEMVTMHSKEDGCSPIVCMLVRRQLSWLK
jgi:hypothetical protein